MDTNTFKLIEGNYTPGDAKEVLLALISSKIQYNQMAAFGLQERQNADVTHHYKRVSELRDVKNAVLDLIENAAAHGFDLSIKGNFHIDLVPAAQATAPVVATHPQSKHPAEPEYYLA